MGLYANIETNLTISTSFPLLNNILTIAHLGST